VSSRSSATSGVTETVVAFLDTVPPFQFLPASDLVRLASHMTLEYFPKDTTIISAGHRAAEALYIVHKGAVKLAMRTQVGKELVFDIRSEGEIFGLLSLMGRDIARLDVTAIEDSLCYSVPGDTMQALISEHKDVADYLLRISITRYMDRSLKELQQQTQLMGDAERLLYSLSVRDVVTRAAVVCPQETTIGEAARIMATSGATCLAVVAPDGGALGMVTDRDFTRRVVAQSLSLDQLVTRIMSAPVVSIESSARLFQGLLAMISHDIQHVLVTEEGLPKAVLSSQDLTLLQGKSPLAVSRHLEQQNTIEGLADAQKRITELLPLLLREGARASHITRVVAEINDRMVAKILELAHAELGPAPLPYCWAVLGSEGRREQTFKTDQDNALIYADVSEGQPAGAYFEKLASFVRSALERCGYPPCTGDFMASNPRWRQPLGVWKNYFHTWMTEAEFRSVQDALIIFDIRPVAGDFSLFESLAASNREILKQSGFFRSILARITIENKPPLGFFRTFVVERSGEHKEELDIKTLGTGPIVNAARLFALDNGIDATNTVDRLAALQPLNYLDETLRRDLLDSFELLTLLRLEHQLQQSRSRQPLSNYIKPASLTHLERSLVKEAFQTIARMQSFINDRFRTAVWSQLGA
jgi:CBS domain-containing protein